MIKAKTAEATVKTTVTAAGTETAGASSAVTAVSGTAAAGSTTATGILATTAGKIAVGAAIGIAAVGTGTAAVIYNDNAKRPEAVFTVASIAPDAALAAQPAEPAYSIQPVGIINADNIVWAAEPGTVDIDYYYNIIGNPYLLFGAAEAEVKGYSISWGDQYFSNDPTAVKYNPDAIVIKKNNKYGIRSYENTILADNVYDNRIEFVYYENVIASDIDNNDNVYVFDNNYQSYTDLFQQRVDGLPDFIVDGEVVFRLGEIHREGGFYEYHVNGIFPVSTSNALYYSTYTSEHFYKGMVEGYAIATKDGSIISLPDGYNPVYTKDMPDFVQYTAAYAHRGYDNDKNSYSNNDVESDSIAMNWDACYVNGVVKLTDGSDVYLWNADTQSFITEDSYQDATFYQEGVIGIEKDSKWAFMDKDGNMLTEYLFDKVSAPYDGKAYVTYNGQIGILDLKTACMNAGIAHEFAN